MGKASKTTAEPKRDAPDSYGQVSTTGYCRNCGAPLHENEGGIYVVCPNGDIGVLPRGPNRRQILRLQSDLPTAIRQATPRGELVRYTIPGQPGEWVIDDSLTHGIQAWVKPRTVWRQHNFIKAYRGNGG